MTAAALLNFLGMAEENGASPWYQPGESAGKRRSGPGTSQAASVEQSALHARRDSEQLLNQIRTSEALASTPASPADQVVDRIFAANRDTLIAALPEVVDKAARETLTGYTPEAAARIAETMIGMLTGTICPVYPGLCTDTEPGHYDHFNHQHAVTRTDGEHILAVGFVQLSDGGPASVYIGGMHHEELLPSEVRAKTAELRRLLDQADEIADKVIAMEAVRNQAEATA